MTGIASLVVGTLALAVLPSAAAAGLTVCNDGATKISVAIGYKDGDWTSEGWWGVEPGACAKVIAGDLPRRYYYYRVSGKDVAFSGQGYYFCTTSAAFTIVGDTECEARGYRREDFVELDVGDATDHRLTLAYGPAPETGLLSASSGIAPGTHGEPFSIVGTFDDCVFEGDYNYCALAAEGWRWFILDDGRTPAHVLDTLSRVPQGAPVYATGDILSYGDITVEAMLRGFEQMVPDANGRLLMEMQGRWQSADDPLSVIEIRGATRTNFYDGAWLGEDLLTVADTCQESQATGSPHLVATELETQESYCYAIDRVGGGWLDLMYLPGGNFLSYRKVQ